MESKPVLSDKQRCSVLGCKSDRFVKSHRYPKDESVCLAWMHLTGNPLICKLKFRQVCEDRYVICCNHFKDNDYACGVRRKLKQGTVPSLFLPRGNGNVGLPQPQEAPPQSEFSPMTLRKWIPKTPDSGFGRKSSLVVGTGWNSSFCTSAQKCEKERGTRKELIPGRNKFYPEGSKDAAPGCSEECDNLTEPIVFIKVEVPESENVVPECSEDSQHVADVTMNEISNSFKCRPSERTVWKKMHLDEKTREMYEQVLEAKREQDACRNRSNRYSPDERLLCLSSYKESSSAYRYPCTFSPLPSPPRVRQILSQIRLDCGVTKAMRDCLQVAADRIIDDLEKVCVLMWDEVSLKLHVQYCAEKDKVIGVEDWGTRRTCKYADHALVFMLRGIKSGWKIPLTYNFCAGQTTSGQLSLCIKRVVRAVTEAGFKIAAMVCDQGSSNMKAIKSLQEDTDKIREEKGIEKYWTILIDDVEIVPLYDPPHLLKCVRNNLLTKDIELDFDRPGLKKKDRKFGSWKDIVTAYEVDVYSSFTERNVPDLTDQHVYADKLRKMRVKMMMQVFSKKMACFVEILAKSGGIFHTSIGDRRIPASGVNTAFILHLMNSIWDGFNGVSSGDDHAKRIPWSDNSYHDEFFKNARKELKSMRFVHPETQKPVKTDIPCLQNLIDTLQGFKMLWKKLKGLGFDSFDTRNINQDPFEDFFGNIKSHDFRSNKPTCFQFEAIFNSILISSLTSNHSPGYNCEEDSGEFLSSECKSLLTCTDYLRDEEDVRKEQNDFIWGNDVQDSNKVLEKSHIQSHSGEMIQILQRSLPEIKLCCECLEGFNKPSSIRTQSTCFRDMHLRAKRLLGRILAEDILHTKLASKSGRVLQSRLDFSFFTCSKHKAKVFCFFMNVCALQYCDVVITYINRVMRGRIVPQITHGLSLPILLAYQNYLKTIRKGKRPRETTQAEPKTKIAKASIEGMERKAASLVSRNAITLGKNGKQRSSTPHR